MHLSGIEHSYVRKHGYEKGIALTNKTSYQALAQVIPGSTKIPANNEALRLWKRTVAVIPFYGGIVAFFEFSPFPFFSSVFSQLTVF
jgi:hypothetical protein